MGKYKLDSKIKVSNKTYVLKDVVELLINYPAYKTVEFFEKANFVFPRVLRVDELRSTLNSSVNTIRGKKTRLVGDMGNRLNWFNVFSETQLINLFNFFKDHELEEKFLENLWLSIVQYIEEDDIFENSFKKLLDNASEHIRNHGTRNFNTIGYLNELNPLFVDEKGKIDGLSPDEFRVSLYKSSTLTEIREIGLKYGVKVPQRLKKSELISVIVEELKARGDYTRETEENLKTMSVLLIQRFIKNNRVNASPEIKKDEIIEHILSKAKETKDTYFIPTANIYEGEAPQFSEVVQPLKNDYVERTSKVIKDTKSTTDIPVKEVVIEKVVEREVPAADTISVDTLNKILAKTSTNTTTTKTRKLDVDSIKGVSLNTVDSGREDVKSYARELNSDSSTLVKKGKNKVKKEKKKRGLIGWLFAIIFYLLMLAFIIGVIVVIYILVTPNGAPESDILQKIEKFINELFNFNAFQKLRDLITKMKP